MTSPSEQEIKGFAFLEDLHGHWVGENVTPFGYFPWFEFDFRPISSSHLHSISEGGTTQSIINSFFIADFQGRQQIMARNGGWLFEQYRTTYFVLDIAESSDQERYYRFVDAVGGEKRAFMEFRFVADSLYFDAYKDDSGTLDEPRHHMGFAGQRMPETRTVIPDYSFPQPISVINLSRKFENLVDPGSALFLEESADPFPKSAHPEVSDVRIDIHKTPDNSDDELMLFLSNRPVLNDQGMIVDEIASNSVVRAVELRVEESHFTFTYVVPGRYYLTVFTDRDGDQFPTSGDDYSGVQRLDIKPSSNYSFIVNLDQKVK